MLSKPVKTLTQIAMAGIVLASVAACTPENEEREEGFRERRNPIEREGDVEREDDEEREDEEERD